MFRTQSRHIVENEGIKIIEIQTQKTGAVVSIPILPPLEALLEKWNYNFPKKMSIQTLNDYIKEICKEAGITEPVTIKRTVGGKKVEEEKQKWELISSHTARRSFATNFYLMGFQASELMPITGHSTEKQFMAYINVTTRQNAKNFAKRAAVLFEKRHLKVV